MGDEMGMLLGEGWQCFLCEKSKDTLRAGLSFQAEQRWVIMEGRKG